MKKSASFALVASLTLAANAFAADGYYATKADERAGRLTPGAPPRPPSISAPTQGNDACPGLAIADPGAGLNFTDSGTTIGANNTVTSVQAGCSNYMGNAGNDVIYTFTLGALANRGTPLTISLDPTGTNWDPSIYTLSTAGAGCPAGTANAATNCVNGADSGGSNATEVITDTETDAMPAGTYFLFVDAFFASSQGTYDLTIGQGALPVELLGFSAE
jgi:hypothetical protein